jgi:phage gpG-like protein
MVFMNITFQPRMIVVHNELRSLGSDIRSFKQPLELARDHMTRSIGENFSRQGRERGAHSSGTWVPLAQATLRRRALEGTGSTILDRRRGQGLRVRASQGARWQINGQRGTLEFTGLPTSVRYGEFHQTGTRNMPARRWLMIHAEDEQEIRRIFAEWLDRRVRERARRMRMLGGGRF